MTFRLHDVEWTSERIRDFWSSLPANDPDANQYFSHRCGGKILAFAGRYVPLKGMKVMDFGCGPGHLIDLLLKRGALCSGIDHAPSSVQAVAERYAGRPGFQGASDPNGLVVIPGGSFDTVFLVEVIEHMTPEQLRTATSGLRGKLRPGGFIIITTPHNEQLERGKTVCPECGCLFHQWQHMQSFTVQSLPQIMQEAGFSTVACEATNFEPVSGFEKLHRAYLKLAGKERFIAKPHLIFIGKSHG